MSHKNETPYRGDPPADIEYVKAPKPPWHPSTRWFIASATLGVSAWTGFNVFAYFKDGPHWIVAGNGVALGGFATVAAVVTGFMGAARRWP